MSQFEIIFPFFLATSGAVLRRAGYEVEIIDAVAEDINLETSYERIKEFDPDVIFSESSTPHSCCLFDLLYPLMTHPGRPPRYSPSLLPSWCR